MKRKGILIFGNFSRRKHSFSPQKTLFLAQLITDFGFSDRGAKAHPGNGHLKTYLFSDPVKIKFELEFRGQFENCKSITDRRDIQG